MKIEKKGGIKDGDRIYTRKLKLASKIKKGSSPIYNIVQGIQQAAYNGQDHASGGSKTDALKREVGDPVLDSRVIDGFAVKVQGDVMKVTYSAVVQLEVALNDNVEQEYLKMVEDLCTFLKKEYKSITGDTLTATAIAEADHVDFQQASNVKTFVFATKSYKIGGLDSSESDSEEQKKKVDKIEKVNEGLNFNKFKRII